ncbi:MAG: DUF6113 family protein [Chitinophagaceae bacterium]
MGQLHKQRTYILIASALGIVTLFLPWLYDPNSSDKITGIGGPIGLIFLAAFVLIAILTYVVGTRTLRMGKPLLALITILSLAITVIGVYDLYFLESGRNKGDIIFNIGIGSYLFPLSGLLITIFCWTITPPKP